MKNWERMYNEKSIKEKEKRMEEEEKRENKGTKMKKWTKEKIKKRKE